MFFFCPTRFEPKVDTSQLAFAQVLDSWLKENSEKSESSVQASLETRFEAVADQPQKLPSNDSDVEMVVSPEAPKVLPPQVESTSVGTVATPLRNAPSAKTVNYLKGCSEETLGCPGEPKGNGPAQPKEPSCLDTPEVPDIADPCAPQFKVGECHISADAMRQRANRIFKVRANGSCRVSDEIRKEWQGRGKPRRLLEDIFKQCGYDPDWVLQSDQIVFEQHCTHFFRQN